MQFSTGFYKGTTVIKMYRENIIACVVVAWAFNRCLQRVVQKVHAFAGIVFISKVPLRELAHLFVVFNAHIFS